MTGQTEARDMGEVIKNLMAAYGAIAEYHSTKKRQTPSPFLTDIADQVFAFLDQMENAWCRRDWAAYRQWAIEFSDEYMRPDRLEPCTAWFELDEWHPWIDETDADRPEDDEDNPEEVRS